MVRNRCYVPFCTTRTQRRRKKNEEDSDEKIVKFKPPKGRVELWDRLIKRADVRLDRDKHYVCIKHFETRFLSFGERITLKKGLTKRNGEVVGDDEYFFMPRMRPRLTPDAVPTIFEGYPSYYQKRKKPRKPPKKRAPLPPKRKAGEKKAEEAMNNDDNVVGEVEVYTSETPEPVVEKPEPVVEKPEPVVEKPKSVVKDPGQFSLLPWNKDMAWDISLTVRRPQGWFCNENSEAYYFFCGFLEDGNFISSKTITFYKNNLHVPVIKIMAMPCNIDQPCYSVPDVEKLLTVIDRLATSTF